MEGFPLCWEGRQALEERGFVATSSHKNKPLDWIRRQQQECLKREVRSRCTRALQVKVNTSLCSFHSNSGKFELPGPGPVGILMTPACPSPFLPHLGYSHPDILSCSAIALFTPCAEICTWETDRVSPHWEAAPASPNEGRVGHLGLEEERN